VNESGGRRRRRSKAPAKKRQRHGLGQSSPGERSGGREAAEEVSTWLQTTVGNRTSTMVHRDPPSYVDVAVNVRDAAVIKAGTLSAFDSHADSQADWSAQISDAAERTELLEALEFARRPNVNISCGEMRVSDVLDGGLDSHRSALLSYTGAQSGTRRTAELPPTADVAKAEGWAEALDQLEPALGGEVLNRSLLRDGTRTQLDDIVAKSWVDDLVSYVMGSRARFEATNGADFASYFLMRAAGVDPVDAVGDVGAYVGSVHRFEPDLITALRANVTDETRSKPLAIILHTSHDHSGAFHRDPAMTDLVKRSTHNTILVEGQGSLEAMQGHVAALATKYGQAGKVREVMVAGHGDSRSMELEGNPYATSDVEANTLSLDANPVATEDFFDAIMDNMEEDPSARIVLNACLTASNAVDESEIDAAASTAEQQQQVVDAINAHPSLATFVAQRWAERAAAEGGTPGAVIGSTGSFPKGPDLINSSGAMDIVWDEDPEMTNPDRSMYITAGSDPAGVMRSLLETWGSDRLAARTAAGARVAGGPPVNYHPLLIHTALTMALAEWDNGQRIAQITKAAEHLAEAIFKKNNEMSSGWAGAWALFERVLAGDRDALFGAVHTHSWIENEGRLAIYQAWAKPARFMSTLGAFSCEASAKYVAGPSWLSHFGIPVSDLLTVGSDSQRRKLAVLALKKEHDADAKQYLRDAYDDAGDFAGIAGFEAAISGYTDADFLEQAIGRGEHAAEDTTGGSPDVENNIDLDGDGTNDFWVQPVTRRAVILASALRLREGPSTHTSIITLVPSGEEVQVIGKRGRWWAVHHGSEVGFMYSRYLDEQPAR
jgi:Bacterial SH3 domain